MKKTLTANISGTVFHIEEDAYDQLQRYLGTIRSRFSGSTGRDEIMGDIEARIAELFTERLDGRRQVVSTEDVDHVIRTMGQPDDYGTETMNDDQVPPGGAGGGGPRGPQGPGRKRLFRHPEDKWVAGLFGGLAAYIGMDALWLRIAFIMLVIFGVGSPILFYLLLWLLVPMADTAAERLMMEGEPITVDNLKRAFDEGSERVKHGAEQMAREAGDMGRRWSGPEGRAYGNQMRQGVESSMRGLGRVIGKVVGVFLVMMGALVTLALVGTLIGGGTLTMDAFGGLEGTGLLELSSIVFESSRHAFWSVTSAIVLLLVPAIGLFLGGLRLLTGLRAPQWLGWTLSALWFAALTVVIIVGLRLGNDFNRSQQLREEVAITQPTGQTLYLGIHSMRNIGKAWHVEYDGGRVDWDMEGLVTSADSIHGAWAELDVTASPDSSYHLFVVRKARGRTEKMAMARASHIGATHVQQDSLLVFSPWVDMPKEDKLRAQQVRFVLQVPVGRAVHFNDGTGLMLYDVDNVTNTWDDDMVGLTWTMTTNGLSAGVRPEDVPDDLPAPAAADSVQQRTVVATPVHRSHLPNVLTLLHSTWNRAYHVARSEG